MSKLPGVIGRYQILDRIGQGGMGALFLAFDPMLERQIAIKLLRDDNEELRERFAREARSVARLRHRNIVTIFDVGEQDGQPFIAMEYIQGQTLADLIRSGAPIHVVRKLQLIDELCDGLAFAHKAGIVHRDVKPANVMVEHEGAVKILDFGIARIAESGMTQAGMLIGTLNYMSPEQVAGQVVDLRSDIFAVGAVLYELLSCRQAFPGGLHNGILNRLLHETPPPLQEACPELDPDVVSIVEQALEKDPAARYQDLMAMRRDLQRVQQRLELSPPETIALRPPEPETVAMDGPTMPARRAQTPRRGTDREGLARRRATQIAAHIEHARQALAAEDYEGAIAAAEQALLLDAEEQDALDLLDRARVAIEERQVNELLNRGADLLQEGALTNALGLADQALTLAPGSAAALRFRESVDRARKERERARVRAERIRGAMDRAQALLERGDFDAAEAAAGEALEIAPDLSGARALQDRARAARQRLEQEAFDRRASAAVEEAGRLFDSDRHQDAIALLETFEPDHQRVGIELARLRQEKDRIDRERREADERARKIAAAIASARQTPGHDEAIRILEHALKIDVAHPEVRTLLSERRAAREDELRQARERREKVAAALTRAKESRSHEAAIQALESALAVEPADKEVRRLLAERQSALEREREAARQAELERQQAEARRERERAEQIAAAMASAKKMADHAAAVAILEGALKLDPEHTELVKQVSARRAARDEEARRTRERREKVAAAITRAKGLASHEAAIQALQGALALEPEDAEVQRLLGEHRLALEREREATRKAQEREKAISAALAEAKATGSHEAAIAILRRALTIDQMHAAVREQLSAREAALEREREEARQARERAERITAAIASANNTPSHDAAIGALESVLKLDPTHADVNRLLNERRAARDEEARQARERHEKAVAAIARAKSLTKHEEAIETLEGVLALEPDNVDARRLHSERQSALERQREAERQARERQAAVAAALAKAARTESHEAAVEILDGALRLEPSNAQVKAMLGERRAARDRQREEERKAAERRETVAAAIKRAKASASHEAAVAMLKEALALEPDHREARALLDSREADLQRERAEATRLRDLEAARQNISALIDKQQFDAAAAALSSAEAALQPGKALKDLKKRLAKSRRAATGQPAGLGAFGAQPGLTLRSVPIVASAAALVLLIAAAAYFMSGPATSPDLPAATGQSAARTETPPAPVPADPQPPVKQASSEPEPAATPTRGSEPTPAPPAGNPAAAPSVPESAPEKAAEPAPNPAVIRAIRVGRQQVAQGNLRQALSTAAGGLKAEPDNRELRSIRDDVLQRMRQQAEAARTSAARHGQAAEELPAFREGTTKLNEAAQDEKSGRYERAAGALLAAVASFGKADREAADALAKAAAAKPAPKPEAPRPEIPSPPATRETTTPGTALPAPNVPPPPPVTAKPPPSTPAAPSEAAPSDDALIRATLREYERAYSSLNVNAVAAIYPSVNASQLRVAFQNLERQQVSIDSEQISIQGNTATVTGMLRQTFKPRTSREESQNRRSTFQLEKVGGRWIIRGVR